MDLHGDLAIANHLTLDIELLSGHFLELEKMPMPFSVPFWTSIFPFWT